MALKRRSEYWRSVKPIGMIAELFAVWKQADHNRWRIAAVSAACTLGMFSLLWKDDVYGPKPPPTITYITTFKPGRSDAEIMASNIANQKLQEKLAAEQAERDEQARQLYKEVGRASGIDVDRIERKARAERAVQEKAQREARARAAQAWKNDPQVKRLGADAALGE